MPPQSTFRTQAHPTRQTHVTATHTITPTPDEPTSHPPTLRLRGAIDTPSESRRIRWAEDVIDNEGMGKKSSKVCCIYHPPRPAGESSSDSDSSSSSDEDSDSGDDGSARPVRRGGSDDNHAHGDACGHPHAENKDQANNSMKGKERRSPNAYEKMPKTAYDTAAAVKEP